MAGLTIPEEHQAELEKIRTLSPESLEALVSSLERTPDSVPTIKGLSPDESEAVQGVVKELYRVREFFEMDVSEFAMDVAAVLQEANEFPKAEVPALTERLRRLLTIEAIDISTKAQSLKAEYERRFCTARILTDLRPIYGDDPSETPSSGMIIHNLRISYHDDTSKLREFYVAMDSDDIKTMRTLLDRAEVKAMSLKSAFARAKGKIVTP